jgi:hypothetical protein
MLFQIENLVRVIFKEHAINSQQVFAVDTVNVPTEESR